MYRNQIATRWFIALLRLNASSWLREPNNGRRERSETQIYSPSAGHEPVIGNASIKLRALTYISGRAQFAMIVERLQAARSWRQQCGDER